MHTLYRISPIKGYDRNSLFNGTPFIFIFPVFPHRVIPISSSLDENFTPPPIPGWIIWPRALIPVLWGESGNLKYEAVEAAVMCGRRTPEAAPISDPSSASAESTNDEEVVSGERLDL
jgi:hypothetical protein